MATWSGSEIVNVVICEYLTIIVSFCQYEGPIVVFWGAGWEGNDRDTSEWWCFDMTYLLYAPAVDRGR